MLLSFPFLNYIFPLIAQIFNSLTEILYFYLILFSLIFFTDLENLVSIDYRIGDKVQINLNASELRAVQSSSDPGWQEKITSVRYCLQLINMAENLKMFIL